jgi:hypothetical protein
MLQDMIYIIPAAADTIDDVIPVGDELGVARYFLAEDPYATVWQKLMLALVSDPLLGLLPRLFGFSLREIYLRRVYRQLEGGMMSGFCFGNEGKVRRYFAPLPYGYVPAGDRLVDEALGPIP